MGFVTHFDIADLKAGARLKWLQALRRYLAPIDRGSGEAGHPDDRPDVLIARQYGEPRDVIGMLVGNQDRVDLRQILVNRGETLSEFLHAQPGVYQDPCILGGQQSGISRTSAREHAELYRGPSPLTLQNTPI